MSALRWTDRQRAMLREFGVHVPAPALAPPAAPAVVPEAVSGGVREPVRGPVRETLPEPGPAREPTAAPAAALGRADWLVVVESAGPASPEALGEERRLLEQMLLAIGVSITDPGRPRATDDAARHASVLALAGDAALPDGVALDAVLAAVQPRLVLCLGRQATRAVLGRDEPPGRLRGTAHALPPGVAGVAGAASPPAVVSWAPHYLLRHPEEKAKAWVDLCLAVATLERL